MIVVTYKPKDYTLSVTGHAHSGEFGHDLVCSAASILAYTLASSVEKMAENHQIPVPDIKLHAGDTLISCKSPEQLKSVVTLMFNTICEGYFLLSNSYPDNIIFQVVEG